MIAVGDRIGCVTVLEVMDSTQAIERDLRGYRGSPAHPKAKGSYVWVRCDCLLEFLVRAREVTRRKNDVRCGKRCELGKAESGGEFALHRWTHCRNPLCCKKLHLVAGKGNGKGRPNRTGFCYRCVKCGAGRHWYDRSRPDAAERAKAHVASNKRRQRKLIQKGLCVRCGRNPSHGVRRCDSCAASRREVESRWKVARIRAGFCTSCERVAAPGCRKCEQHMEMDRTRQQQRRDAAKMGAAA